MTNPKQTKRQEIIDCLKTASMTANDLSRAVHLREKEIYSHLEHIRKSLKHRHERFTAEPSRCHGCGFEFKDRKKLTPPGKCPLCKSERIFQTMFRIDELR
jgi:predicted Zn-ribbon and HTH transcriptional regulator